MQCSAVQCCAGGWEWKDHAPAQLEPWKWDLGSGGGNQGVCVWPWSGNKHHLAPLPRRELFALGLISWKSQILIMLDPICYADNANFILGAHSRKFLQHKKGLKDSSAEVWLFWLFIDLGSWGFIETRVEILSCDVQAHCGSPCGSLALWSHCGHGRSTYWILFSEYWIHCFLSNILKKNQFPAETVDLWSLLCTFLF